MPWKNGEIPESELTIFHRGRNNIDGDWYHGLTPATYARHLALVARAKARTGRTLTISEGWGAYRPVAAQIIARNRYGNGAAVPRTSSHGGFWENRETMAMDYSNWGYVYDWDRAAFYEDVRAVGLTPGMISKERGYPDEPWHVIDLNPRTLPAFAGSQEEGDMTAEDVEKIRKNTDLAGANVVEQVRANTDAAGASVVAQIATLIALLPQAIVNAPVQAQDEKGMLLSKGGKPVVYPLGGFIASTNARVGGGRTEVTMTDEQAQAMANPVAEALRGSLVAAVTQAAASNFDALLAAINELGDTLPADVREELAAGLLKK